MSVTAAAAKKEKIPSAEGAAPCVSVVVPIYNQEKYLQKALSSLQRQTLQNMEFICVNDGSTDRSLEIMRQFAAEDPRFVIIDKPNSGYGHSMNVGMDAAKGQYVGILEPDDYVPSDMYETLYVLAVENTLDLVKADYYRFYELPDGSVERERVHLCPDKADYSRLVDPANELKSFSFAMNTWSGIYLTDFIRRNRIRHNETPGAAYQDNGFWFQTFCLAHRARFVDQPFYMYRQDNPNSSINNKRNYTAITEEYRFIENWLAHNPKLKQKYEGVMLEKKFLNCMHTYRHLQDDLKKDCLSHIRAEFLPPFQEGRLDKKLFSPASWHKLQLILHRPEAFDRRYRFTISQRVASKEYHGLLAPLFRKIHTLWCVLRYGDCKVLQDVLNKKLKGSRAR